MRPKCSPSALAVRRYDSTAAKSSFATLECELLLRVPFASWVESARELIVEAFYNPAS